MESALRHRDAKRQRFENRCSLHLLLFATMKNDRENNGVKDEDTRDDDRDGGVIHGGHFISAFLDSS